jgi:hypothetical protein
MLSEGLRSVGVLGPRGGRLAPVGAAHVALQRVDRDQLAAVRARYESLLFLLVPEESHVGLLPFVDSAMVIPQDRVPAER